MAWLQLLVGRGAKWPQLKYKWKFLNFFLFNNNKHFWWLVFFFSDYGFQQWILDFFLKGLAQVPCFLTSHSNFLNVWNVKKYGAVVGYSSLSILGKFWDGVNFFFVNCSCDCELCFFNSLILCIFFIYRFLIIIFLKWK